MTSKLDNTWGHSLVSFQVYKHTFCGRLTIFTNNFNVTRIKIANYHYCDY